MERLIFEWNNETNQINQIKHSILFEEAESVFYDDNAIQFWDEDHSDAEDRFYCLAEALKCEVIFGSVTQFLAELARP